jgi:hypothetical protein
MNVSANILFWFAGSSPSSRRGGTGSFLSAMELLLA